MRPICFISDHTTSVTHGNKFNEEEAYKKALHTALIVRIQVDYAFDYLV
jgi:hypothetical protein